MRALETSTVVLNQLDMALAAAGSYAALSRAAGVSDEYVRQCAIGERPVTGKLLRYLGFERVIAYRRVA